MEYILDTDARIRMWIEAENTKEAEDLIFDAINSIEGVKIDVSSYEVKEA